MNKIKLVSLISLLTLNINTYAGQKTLLDCGFPIAGEQFDGNLNDLLSVAEHTTPMEMPNITCGKTKADYSQLCTESETRKTLPDNHPSGFYYRYELVLAKLAKADPVNDSDEDLTKKINHYIKSCSKFIVCDSVNLKTPDIDLFKMSVAIGSFDFLEKAVALYSWPLNEVDKKDNKSILDYIYDEYVYYVKKGEKIRTEGLAKLYKAVNDQGGKHHSVTPKVDIK